MKILLTAIFKDDSEYESIERMLKSFKPYIAGLCVTLTSVDCKKLKKLIKEYNGQYNEVFPGTHPKIFPDGEFGNFAEARMECFKLASEMQAKESYDWWTWADSDDILINGEELLKVAELAQKNKMDMVFFTYWYSINLSKGSFSDKDVQIDHLRERLLNPKIQWKWVSRLHEIALPIDDNYKPKITTYDYNPQAGRGCVWAHLTTKERTEKSMERNIKILEQQAKDEQHKDPRTIFYLAKTYFDVANVQGKKEYFQLADLLLDDYLNGEHPSGWAEERSNAWEYKGKIRALTGNHRAAIECYHSAIAEYGNRHMPFLLLAGEYAEIGDQEQATFWLDTAVKMEAPQARTTIGNPQEIKYLAASLKFNEAVRKQDVPEAIRWLTTRNEIAGIKDDPMMKALIESKQLNDAAMWVFNYSKWLKDTGHEDLIPNVLKALPVELGREAFAHVIANDYTPSKKWSDKSIVYFANFGGEFFEKFSGKTVEAGQGGSETAVVRLCERWAKMGYEVTVFCDPREDVGIINGVDYRPFYEMNWKDEFNILILWRSPHILDRDIKAKKLFMDLHDVASQLDWSEERMKKIDKVFVKSKYHRAMLPKLPDQKVEVISNGI